jgi:hypothetical protein
MKVRRIVSGRDFAGKSCFVADSVPPNAHDFVHIPGMQVAHCWATAPVGVIPREFVDPTLKQTSVVPPPGGTHFLIVTFPPDTVMQSADFDPAAASAENMKHVPGLAEQFETEHPGMHTTDTIDYGVVLDGEISLELDDGRLLDLHRHDVVIQNGTRHAWRNRSNKPAVMAFVLIGAKRQG